MAIKLTSVFHFKALQNLPKLEFWFESVPSGNPGRLSEAAMMMMSAGANARVTLTVEAPCFGCLPPGMPDFSWHNIPKPEKYT
jgi:hypothetical protein